MSARSAYSRKVNAKKHSRPAIPPATPTVPAPPVPALSRPESHDNFDVNYHPEGSGAQPLHGRPRSISHASGSSHDTPRSAIEKSLLRQAMDENSEKVRNKISITFTGKPEMGSNIYKEQQLYAQQEATTGPPSHRDQACSPYAASSRSSGTQPSRTFMPRSNTSGLSSDSNSKSNEPTEKNGFRIKKFLGNAKKTQPWMKLKHDPELWDDMGDTLIYYSSEVSQSKALPEPSFRLSSAALEESSESQFFMGMLRESHISELCGGDRPPSPNDSPHNPVASNQFSESQQGPCQDGQESVEQNRSPRSFTRMRHNEQSRSEPTPPVSSDNSQERRSGAPVHHELFFPISSNGSSQTILREHLSVRNVFALVLSKSLVGLDLCQTLSDLLARFNQYMPDRDNKRAIIEYIFDQGLQDVRNDPESASGLLAWSELEGIQWLVGWREGFIHSVGMYDDVRKLPTFSNLNPMTRHLLEQKSAEMLLRNEIAERVLAEFDFREMWPMSSANPPMAKVSFIRFQQSLREFYKDLYPQRANGRPWLDREVARRLQEDFAILYDFIVDHGVIWDKKDDDRRNADHDEQKVDDSRQWKRNAYEYRMIKKGDPHFTADQPNLPIVDMFISFDLKHAGAHIPHPFPLLPDPSKPITPPKKSKFGFTKPSKNTQYSGIVARQTECAYARATNVYALGSISKENALIQFFKDHEYEDKISEVDPHDARLGRWILLYGILQVLSHISGDTPGLLHTSGVKYFLNPNTNNCPPWEQNPKLQIHSFDQEHSHCWLAAKCWESERSTQLSNRRKYLEIKIQDYENGLRTRSYSNSQPPL
ncbi:MAG: hypothetical protein M1835_005807, partial [Candelina submexicana]